MYLLLYIDDVFIACKDIEEYRQLSVEFDMKVLRRILGMDILIQRRVLSFCHNRDIYLRYLKILVYPMRKLSPLL